MTDYFEPDKQGSHILQNIQAGNVLYRHDRTDKILLSTYIFI